ncbi:MAG: YqgE/AlgH family protein [Acidimicrobiales bacterium]|nr:YqgE/AlgH family protein [Acidimicrobiales bacterium]
MSGDFHAGRLLVATPLIGDPNFERTVVLLLEHNDDGALGLVLNRPTDLSVLDPLPEWYALASTPGVVFVGGPVDRERAIGLAHATDHEGAGAAEGFNPVLGGLGTLDLSCDPRGLVAHLDRVRVFAGYAGWTSGQLEQELDAGAWFVVDADADDAWCADPGTLWRTVLRRQRGTVRWFADYPADPGSN